MLWYSGDPERCFLSFKFALLLRGASGKALFVLGTSSIKKICLFFAKLTVFAQNHVKRTGTEGGWIMIFISK